MQFSLVVPLLNESESLEELYQWIEKSLKGYSFELLFVDDGSTDDSWSIITELAKKHDTVKGIRFAQNFGKSQALHAAFSEVQGKYVVTLDADLQDSPEEILPMVALMEEKQWDLISGWKKKRYDSFLFKKANPFFVILIPLYSFTSTIKRLRETSCRKIFCHSFLLSLSPIPNVLCRSCPNRWIRSSSLPINTSTT